jgi:16S rRNA (uracil1498-N3)-methyltransferase
VAPDVALPDDEAHHVRDVLRLGAGDALIVFDGAGREWDARVASIGKRGVTATLATSRQPVAERTTRVTLAVGVLKGHAMDEVVRAATALGVTTIVPMASAHCVVSKQARGEEAIERWHRIAVASAKQCGRATLPAIRNVTPFADVLRLPGDLRLICLEPALETRPGLVFSEKSTPQLIDIKGVAVSTFAEKTSPGLVSVLLLVGPEGGWAPEEVDAASVAGFRGLSLGPLTLRAELAPTVALSQLWAGSAIR